jgi:hypothetical protein
MAVGAPNTSTQQVGRQQQGNTGGQLPQQENIIALRVAEIKQRQETKANEIRT